MAGDAEHYDADNVGVRRRHSAQHEHEIMAPVEGQSGRPSTEILSNTRMSATDLLHNTNVPQGPRTSSEQPPRVRFSTDIERKGQWPKGKKRKSDESLGQMEGASERPGTSNLSVDTSIAAADRSVMGSSPVLSPSSMTSPTASKSSPLSPRGRQRGYSLRSSLFQRTMRDKSSDAIASESVIEMNDMGPSNQSNSLSRQFSRQTTADKSGRKSMNTVVEISPAFTDRDDDDLKLPTIEPRHGVHGISALPNYQSWIQNRAAHNAAWRSIRSTYSRGRKFVLRINDIPPTKDGRHIDLDPSRKPALIDERTGHQYVTNTIRSSRYNAWNFLPRQLFAQFSKIANFYFLCVSILQMIPGLSTTGSKYKQISRGCIHRD